MVKIRWDWIVIGACAYLCGLGTSAWLWEYIVGDTGKLVMTTATSILAVASAMFIVHYKDRVESREYEKFVLQTLRSLNEEAQVLHMLRLEMREGLPGEARVVRRFLRDAMERFGKAKALFLEQVVEDAKGSYALRSQILHIGKELVGIQGYIEGFEADTNEHNDVKGGSAGQIGIVIGDATSGSIAALTGNAPDKLTKEQFWGKVSPMGI